MRASSVIVSSVLRLLGFSKSKRIGRYLRCRGGGPDPGDLDAPAGPPFAVCRPYWREGPVNLPRARRCHTPLFPRSVLLHHRAGVAAPGSIDVAGRTNRMISLMTLSPRSAPTTRSRTAAASILRPSGKRTSSVAFRISTIVLTTITSDRIGYCCYCYSRLHWRTVPDED